MGYHSIMSYESMSFTKHQHTHQSKSELGLQ